MNTHINNPVIIIRICSVHIIISNDDQENIIPPHGPFNGAWDAWGVPWWGVPWWIRQPWRCSARKLTSALPQLVTQLQDANELILIERHERSSPRLGLPVSLGMTHALQADDGSGVEFFLIFVTTWVVDIPARPPGSAIERAHATRFHLHPRVKGIGLLSNSPFIWRVADSLHGVPATSTS